ncbi:hypothetical protein GH714_026815 [Hevea brasiliensis]|uniref:protein-serine/threonine phosphatase n=1 Tax=Hevea brasiliensis TaxID=3981 RepID=A0A6A6MI72_HEVBR|nr:hypothetical protein GH714_026815 [Hevea brasiliensis]
MLRDEDEDSLEKCTERRRRRIEMRRLASTSEDGTTPPVSESHVESSSCVAKRKRIRTAETEGSPEACLPVSSEDNEESEAVNKPLTGHSLGEPTFGTMSVAGRSREMEDAIAACTSLCRPEINGRRPVHFFGVYDGHGGSHVAELCRERMHVFLERELMRVDHTDSSENGDSSSSGNSGEPELQRQGGVEEKWRRVLKRSFELMDEAALSKCACGGVGFDCGCHLMEVALGGSTAVVAVLTSENIVVANCGDSRAILCRGGRAVPLSFDHKPDRPDELARIEAAGGRVIFVNGARVEGILAMSRAIGDKYLKPVVTSEPEITFTKREPEDECLILASDGLWDVLSSELACEVACECLQEGSPPTLVNDRSQIDEGNGALYPTRSILAAALLTRLALGRRSSDNISVIVVDLKRSRR